MTVYFKKAYGLSLLVLIIALTVVLCVWFHRFFHPYPDSFKPGVRLGKGMFQKTLFFEDPRLDYVSDIKYGRFHPRRGLEYCIAGNMGAVFLDKNIQLVEFLKLKNERFPLVNYQIITNDSGECSFVGKKISDDLRFCVYPFELNGQELPFIYKDNYWVAAEGTSNEIRFPLPYFLDIRGTSVYFENNKPLYYAVLGKSGLQAFVGFKLLRLNLFIFDSNKQLIYNEVLEDEATVYCTAIKAVSSEGSTGQFLLVGGTSRVWKYTLADGRIMPAEKD